MAAARFALTRTPHLAALGCAALILAIVGVAAFFHLAEAEAGAIHGMCARVDLLPTRSPALQRLALAQPDLLPVYGSSELAMPVDDRATLFFRAYPTGFEVFPIGQAGTYPLITLQKLAAAGSALRDRKLAISLSSGWFRHAEMSADAFRGNYSPLDRSALLFSRELSMRLKRDVARRLVSLSAFPDHGGVADFAQRQLADSSRLARLRYWAAWPLGWLQTHLLRLQDHYEVARWLAAEDPRQLRVHRQATDIDWAARITAAEERVGDTPDDDVDPSAFAAAPQSLDPIFISHIRTSALWIDLHLLLRTLRELGARPLILSTPFNGPYQSALHISRGARQLYYDRLMRVVGYFDFPCLDFQEHDEDKRFAADQYDHLSPKGWMIYNRALDDFFHDRAGVPAVAPVAMRPRGNVSD